LSRYDFQERIEDETREVYGGESEVQKKEIWLAAWSSRGRARMFLRLRHYVALASDYLWLVLSKFFKISPRVRQVFQHAITDLNYTRHKKLLALERVLAYPGFTPGPYFFVTSGLGSAQARGVWFQSLSIHVTSSSHALIHMGSGKQPPRRSEHLFR
jgi:hypothetical protein